MTHHVRLLAIAALASGSACLGSSGDRASEASLTAAQCSAAVAWAPSTHYAVGDVVTFQGATYQCIQAHTSQSDWTPAAVPALWSATNCATGGGGGSGGGGTGGGTGGGGSGGGTCDASAWVFMEGNPNACDGKIGESCGWTSTNLGQGFHCAVTSWRTGCEPGGT